MAYKLMKRIIERGNFDESDVMDKLDAFLAADRITSEEYTELSKLAKEGDHHD